MGANQRVTRRPRVMFVFVRSLTALVTMAMITLGTLAMSATASGAATTYTVQASAGLIERSTPSTSGANLGSLANGTAITIACQTTGTNVGGSAIWDQLATPRAGVYVSDDLIGGTAYAVFTLGIPQCGATTVSQPSPPPAPAPAPTPVPSSSYHVQAGIGTLYERSSPSTSAAKIGSLAAGATVHIACQTTGTVVNGSPIWDRLDSATTGPYVSDDYIIGTKYAVFTPGIGQCGSASANPPPSPAPAPAPATPNAATREQGAVNFAYSILNSTDPTWDYQDHEAWSGRCETFAERAYGTIGKFGTAYDQYLWQKSQGQIHTDTNPPPCVEVFYDSWETNSKGVLVNMGHVAISIGGGQTITTWGFVGNRDKVRIEPVTAFANKYYGWAIAPPSWPGLISVQVPLTFHA